MSIYFSKFLRIFIDMLKYRCYLLLTGGCNMGKEIGSVLREYRIKSGITVKQISSILTAKGFKASEKTIYSWENNNSQPTPDALLIMCDAYDILLAFGYNGKNEYGDLVPNYPELQIIEKYRMLDQHGKKLINMILDAEVDRCTTHTQEQSSPSRIINYYYRLASAGSGQIVFDMPPTESIEIPDIPEYKHVDYAIGVNGNSMEPVFNDGEILLVQMTEEIEPGEIGIFIVDGQSYVKKLGNGELISLNKGYDNVELTSDSKCVGRVITSLPHN